MWAVVELMGHRVMAGRVSEVTFAGAGMVLVEVFVGDAPEPVASPMHAPSALYGITPCTEEHARRVAGFHLRDLPTRPALPAPTESDSWEIVSREHSSMEREGDDGDDGHPWSDGGGGGDEGPLDIPFLPKEERTVVEGAIDALVHVDEHMTQRVEAARRLASLYGLEWPRGCGEEDEDEGTRDDLGAEGIAP